MGSQYSELFHAECQRLQKLYPELVPSANTFTWQGKTYEMVPYKSEEEADAKCTDACPLFNVCSPTSKLNNVKGPCTFYHPIEKQYT